MKKADRDKVERWRVVKNAALKGLHWAMTQHTWGEKQSPNPMAYDASLVVASAVIDELTAQGFEIRRSGIPEDERHPGLKALTDGGVFAMTRIGITGGE